MIYQNSVVTINKGEAKIDTPIFLYRGDKEVEINFTILNSPFKYRTGSATNLIESTEADYAQLIIKVPNDRTPVFSEITETKNGKIVFKITADMIDEIEEVGKYDFQIRLFDSEQVSKVTIPPVEGGIEIREPIAIEDEIVSTSNEVNVATANYAVTTTATPLDVFDEDGNYIETTWTDKMLITDARLNKIEDGITGVNQKADSIATMIPTKTSQLNNDSNYATETYVDNAIENIEITGGSTPTSASNITIADTADNFTATNVEGALQEVGLQIKDIVNNGGNGVTSNMEPENDDIPKIFFYGDVSTMSKSTDVDLDFEYKSRTASYKGVANTKWQGSSSLSYDKKNYTIKLFTDNTKSSKLKLNLKGWGNQNKFCLKANYVDSLHVRNLAGARIAYDMIKSRSDFSSLPTELQEAPRCGVIDGFPIKVYINGELMGLYTWNIPKDKWCSNMDEDNVNHAFLMAEKNNNRSSTDSLVLACEFRANATIFADTSTEQYPAYDWVVEGPGDDVSDDIRTSFNNLINCVKDTDDDTFKSTIGNYLDLTSAFDYYCFAYFVCHYDGLGKNLGMATYDGVKWFCTLYDMDSIFGASINGSSFLETDRQCPEEYQETNSLLWQRIEECFGEELYARYLELRQGPLSLGNIFTHVEEIYDIIPDRAYTEDRAKWTSLPSVSSNTTARIRTYMIDRSTYVDAEMLEIGSRTPCTGITLDVDTLEFTSADTQTLTATVTPDDCTDTITWSSSSDNIATVSDGVVTPVANGECTITATCGSYSATCTVTVSGMSESGGDTTDATLLIHVNSSSLTSESTTWEDLSGNNNTFTLSDGTPDVDDNGLLMTSVKVHGDTNITLNGTFSTEITFYIPKSADDYALYSLNQDNSTKYCESAPKGYYKVNGYAGNTTTTVTTPAATLITISAVHNSNGQILLYKDGTYIATYDRGTFTAIGDYKVVLGSSSYNNYPINNSKFRIKSFKLYDGEQYVHSQDPSNTIELLSLTTEGKGANSDGTLKDE